MGSSSSSSITSGRKSEETLTQHTYQTKFGKKPDHEQIKDVKMEPEVVVPGKTVKLKLDIRWQTWGPTCITQYCVGVRPTDSKAGPAQKKCLFHGTTDSNSRWMSKSATFSTTGLPDGKYDIVWTQQMQYTTAKALAGFKSGPCIAQFVVGEPGSPPSKPAESAQSKGMAAAPPVSSSSSSSSSNSPTGMLDLKAGGLTGMPDVKAAPPAQVEIPMSAPPAYHDVYESNSPKGGHVEEIPMTVPVAVPVAYGSVVGGGGGNIVQELAQLATLRETGALSEEEFTKAKGVLLGNGINLD